MPCGGGPERPPREREADHDRLVEELRLSQRHLAAVQRIAHVGSWERDVETGVLRWSDESCRIVGLAPGAFPGTLEAYLALVHPDDRARVAPDLSTLALVDPAPIDYRIIRPDGSIRILHEDSAVIRDLSGRPLTFIGTTQDITDRVAADDERARLASAIEQTADAVWMQTLDNVVSYVNPAFTRTYGWAAAEFVGQNASLVDSGRHDPAFFSQLWGTARAGRTWTGSITNRRKDGSLFEVEAVVSGLRDASGEIVGYMQTDRDVTRERLLENAIERQARERDAIVAALDRIDPAAPPEEIAAAACAEIVGHSDVESAFVVILEPDRGWVLATQGRNAEVMPPGTAVPEFRLRYLRDRATRGPWVEAWRPTMAEAAQLPGITAARLDSAAYAPFACADGTIGIIGLGSYDP
ncbi:MAG: hypothetical protein NVS9B8_05050 [Candidatus Limnocylindrales bacterium]